MSQACLRYTSSVFPPLAWVPSLVSKVSAYGPTLAHDAVGMRARCAALYTACFIYSTADESSHCPIDEMASPRGLNEERELKRLHAEAQSHRNDSVIRIDVISRRKSRYRSLPFHNISRSSMRRTHGTYAWRNSNNVKIRPRDSKTPHPGV